MFAIKQKQQNHAHTHARTRTHFLCQACWHTYGILALGRLKAGGSQIQGQSSRDCFNKQTKPTKEQGWGTTYLPGAFFFPHPHSKLSRGQTWQHTLGRWYLGRSGDQGHLNFPLIKPKSALFSLSSFPQHHKSLCNLKHITHTSCFFLYYYFIRSLPGRLNLYH